MTIVDAILRTLRSGDQAVVILLTSQDYDRFRAELQPETRPLFNIVSSHIKFSDVPMLPSRTVQRSVVLFADLSTVDIVA